MKLSFQERKQGLTGPICWSTLQYSLKGNLTAPWNWICNLIYWYLETKVIHSSIREHVAGNWRQLGYPSPGAKGCHARVKSNARETYLATGQYVKNIILSKKIEKKKCISPNHTKQFHRHKYIWKYKLMYSKRYKRGWVGNISGDLK